MILTSLIASLSAVSLAYGAYLLWSAARAGQFRPNGEAILLGAVTNFFDTLGIGSFAPSIAWIRFRSLVPDRLIPLTMLGGYILPAIAQALIFLILLGVKIDPLLLLQCIVAMVLGGIVGVPIAARAPIRLVQGVVGLALLVAGFFYTLANLGLMPPGEVRPASRLIGRSWRSPFISSWECWCVLESATTRRRWRCLA